MVGKIKGSNVDFRQWLGYNTSVIDWITYYGERARQEGSTLILEGPEGEEECGPGSVIILDLDVVARDKVPRFYSMQKQDFDADFVHESVADLYRKDVEVLAAFALNSAAVAGPTVMEAARRVHYAPAPHPSATATATISGPTSGGDGLLQLDKLLADFHATVWHAGAGDDGPIDYDEAGKEEAKAIRNHVQTMVGGPKTVRTGHRLTDMKANHIMERDGYKFTGVILCDDEGRRSLVEMSAVRWLSKDEMWDLMHPDNSSDAVDPDPSRQEHVALMRWHLVRLLQAWRYGGDIQRIGLAAFEWARTNDVGTEAFAASAKAVKLAVERDVPIAPEELSAVGIIKTFSGKAGLTWIIDPSEIPEGSLLYAEPPVKDQPLDLLWKQTLQERDAYHDWADRLAAEIGKHLGIDVGEHSNVNSPWDVALKALKEFNA